MRYIYECRLEVPAWTSNSDTSRAEQYRPRLVFTRHDFGDHDFGDHDFGDPELLAQVSAWADDLPGRDRWIAQFYPPQQTDLHRQDDEGDRWRRWRRWPRRLDPMLSAGEVRHPRDTSPAALNLALELLADIIPKGDLVALKKVAEILRPQLEQTARAYLTHFRPIQKRQASPK